MSGRSTAAINLALFGMMVVVNALANSLPINGRTTAQVSDSFPSLFVPAGYVFAIWGVIYLALAAHVLYALTAAGGRDPRVAAVRPLLSINFAANAAWILSWHYRIFPVSLALMAVILVSLTTMYARLDAVDRTGAGGSYRLTRLPISLYLGWISVATIANATVVLLDAGWNGAPFPPEAWALVMVAMATALNLLMVARSRDIVFGAVGAWALAGIAVRRASDFPAIANVSVAGGLLISIAVLIVLARLLRAPRAR